jgi:hypothetical protein
MLRAATASAGTRRHGPPKPRGSGYQARHVLPSVPAGMLAGPSMAASVARSEAAVVALCGGSVNDTCCQQATCRLRGMTTLMPRRRALRGAASRAKQPGPPHLRGPDCPRGLPARNGWLAARGPQRPLAPRQPRTPHRSVAAAGRNSARAVRASATLRRGAGCRGGCSLREAGVEPARVSPQDPKSCASASSATLAQPSL